jgi:phosphotransferase system HPr-like phosphotransfer protein
MLVNKRYFFALLYESERLESFLDDHGARHNLHWLYFSELVACARNFSLAGFHLSHILDRYTDYLGGEDDPLRRDFTDRVYEILDYFASVLSRFHDEMVGASRSDEVAVGLSSPPSDWRLAVSPQLPYTITGEDADGEDERVIAICQSYRRLVKRFREKHLHRTTKAKTLSELIPTVVNETMMASFETDLHSIQSEYDTYIRGGVFERTSADAGHLRGLTAIPMHLFEALRWLTHFYERHENEIRKSDVKSKISELVNDDRLFDGIVGFGLKYVSRYLSEGNQTAERILSSFVKPVAMTLPIPQPQGFHARPATYVSLIVQEHGTDVHMTVAGETFDCRSVLEMLEAGGLLAEMELTDVAFVGDQRALDDIKILADHNYCEDRDIPPELYYLRIMRNL